MKYIEGSLTKREVKDYTSFKDFFYVIPEGEKFLSLFLFEDGVTTSPTRDNYSGIMYLPYLILDIDDDIEKVRSILTKLMEYIPKEYFHVFFSGRGYHIYILNAFKDLLPQPNLDIKTKEFVRKMWQKFSFTSDNIYDKGRVIRRVNSINSKTNLYKISLRFEEVFTLTNEQIKSLAEVPRVFDSYENTFLDWENAEHNIDLVSDTQIEITKIEIPNRVNVINCVQHMYENGPIYGQRHNTVLRIASAWRRAGVPKEATALALLNWSKLPEAELFHIVNDVYEKGYRYSCFDVLMNKYCDSRCIYYRNKDYDVDVFNITEYTKNYIQYLQNTKKILDLKNSLYLDNSYSIYEGEFVLLIGDTGLGKTALAQWIVLSTNVRTLYISLEVHLPLLFRRFIQAKHGLTKEEANEAIMNNILSLPDNIILMEESVTLEKLYSLITELNVDLVVIDTIDGLKVDSKSIFEFTDKIGKELKSIAISTKSAILGIHHINKVTSYLGTGLDVHSTKGASTLEQKADKVIGISGHRDQPLREITSLKARDESHFRKYLKFNPLKFKFEV